MIHWEKTKMGRRRMSQSRYCSSRVLTYFKLD
jgi:hypothetical protein